ncbi:MAG: histidine kinase [Sphingobacteriales bacterium]|nr:histidine kinase [Sphingobacteriales bacterium]
MIFHCTDTCRAENKCRCLQYDNLNFEDTAEEGVVNRLLNTKDNICLAKAYEIVASKMFAESRYDSTEFYLNEAFTIYHASSCSQGVFLNVYKKWAGLYYAKGDYPKSLEYSLKLKDAAESDQNIYELANCCTMIAQLFNQMGQADRGIGYTRRAVKLTEQLEFSDSNIDILFKISKRYLWHYQDTKLKTSLDTAEYFAFSYLYTAQQLKIFGVVSEAYSNIQGVFYEKQDYPNALMYLDSSFLYIGKGSYADKATNFYDKADILLDMKSYADASACSDSALFYYNLTGSIAYIADVFELKYRIASGAGDNSVALISLERYRGIKDSLAQINKTAVINELEKKYNQTKNEKTIKELNQQKQIFLLLAVSALLIVVVIAFIMHQRTLYQRQLVLETEERLNRARMNPHFFFNALTSLQAFALRENDGKLIATNLSKFSHIMREILESTYKEYVTLVQEIDFQREYLDLQKIRYPDKFSYAIELDEMLDPDDTLIPSMIIQPFVENSIEHGFAGITYPGHIILRFYTLADEIVVEIVDNGKGFTALKSDSGHISRARQIVIDRIYLLNIRLKCKARFTLDNNPEGSGIKVVIYLPFISPDEIAYNRQ